jgi:hypothetical protein
LIVNAVAAVLAGCACYVLEYLYKRFIAPQSEMQGVPSIAK